MRVDRRLMILASPKGKYRGGLGMDRISILMSNREYCREIEPAVKSLRSELEGCEVCGHLYDRIVFRVGKSREVSLSREEWKIIVGRLKEGRIG